MHLGGIINLWLSSFLARPVFICRRATPQLVRPPATAFHPLCSGPLRLLNAPAGAVAGPAANHLRLCVVSPLSPGLLHAYYGPYPFLASNILSSTSVARQRRCWWTTSSHILGRPRLLRLRPLAASWLILCYLFPSYKAGGGVLCRPPTRLRALRKSASTKCKIREMIYTILV
jgi:hypothetical protein